MSLLPEAGGKTAVLEAQGVEQAKRDDGQHRYRNGRADGQTRLETQIGVGGTEDDAQEDSRDRCLERELGQSLAGGIGDVRLPRLELVSGEIELFAGQPPPMMRRWLR